ncbi:MAG: type II secretion system protein GspG [Candidatus Sumerlaeaceae bacterium]|nr:type II secretion system protein GspG [Candidatus Sumerlaeaceae bacterium]
MRKPISCRGFTLIELLIVVAIIAILAAIAVPNFLEAQVRSKVSRNKADLRSLATGLEAYAVDNNAYPPAWDTTFGGTLTWGTLVTPPFHSRVPNYITTPISYMTSLPEDPFRSTTVGALTPPLNLVERRQIYFNFKYYFVTPSLAPPNVNNFTEATKLAGAWLMYSIGPDRDEFNTPGAVAVVGQRVYRDYDPTNGTVSLGNVFRTQGSGDKLGTVAYFYTTP